MAYENLGKAVDRVTALLPKQDSEIMTEEQRDDLEAMLYALDGAALELREYLATPPPEDPRPLYPLQTDFLRDEAGFPAGGKITGRRFTVHLQEGARGQGEERVRPNGACIEDFLGGAKLLLEHFQDTNARSEHNEMAIRHVNAASDEMNRRRAGRAERGVWGLNAE